MKTQHLLCITLALTTAAVAQPDPTPAAHRRTDWFHHAKWGVFMHYMADTVLKGDELTIENWNKAVDSFDVKGLADQLSSAGAGYFVLTLGQNSGYYCAPNAAYDRLTGIAPSKCARRDLVADLVHGTDEDAYQRATALGHDLRRAHRVVVVSAGSGASATSDPLLLHDPLRPKTGACSVA